MSKILIKSPRKVLVKAAPQVQYDMQGTPSLVFGTGGGSSGARSKRERALGALGGTIGVLGALTGRHRSLGGLLGQMYTGGAQGSGMGRALGRGLTSRRRQAEIAAKEKEAQTFADMRVGRKRQGLSYGSRKPWVKDSPWASVMRRERPKSQQGLMGEWGAEEQGRKIAEKLRGQQEALWDHRQQDIEYQKELARQERKMRARAELSDREEETTQANRARTAQEHIGVMPRRPTQSTLVGVQPGTGQAMIAANPTNANLASIPTNMGTNSQGSTLAIERVPPGTDDHRREGLDELQPKPILTEEEETAWGKLAEGAPAAGFGQWRLNNAQ